MYPWSLFASLLPIRQARQTNTDPSSSLANPSPADPPIAPSACRKSPIYNIQVQDMLPPPAEQQELLLQWLAGMPPVEHERFLGNWLYLLVQVHICLLSLRPAPLVHQLCTGNHGFSVLQAVDPAARVGKLTGMLLEQDVDQIVPLLFFSEMVRDHEVAQQSRAHSPTRAVLRATAATG